MRQVRHKQCPHCAGFTMLPVAVAGDTEPLEMYSCYCCGCYVDAVILANQLALPPRRYGNLGHARLPIGNDIDTNYNEDRL